MESVLERLPFWKLLTDSEKELVRQNAVIRRHKKGTTVYNSERECLGMLFVMQGEMRTYLLSEEGREVTLFRMMPQNQWLSAASPLSWGIYRNIPFALMGLLIIVLFYQSAKQHGDSAFRWMWLTIVLSFGFYIPVVLWADTIPMIGMLMIPKTCAYVWTVLIGYSAMKKECK